MRRVVFHEPGTDIRVTIDIPEEAFQDLKTSEGKPPSRNILGCLGRGIISMVLRSELEDEAVAGKTG